MRTQIPNPLRETFVSATHSYSEATLERSRLPRAALIGLMLVPIVLFTVAAISLRPHIEGLNTFGYLGLFVWNVIASGTLAVPLPGLATVFAAAAVWNPALVALAGATGSTLGEGTSYLAGRGSRSTTKGLSERGWYARIDGWMQRRGSMTIFVFAILPLPFFDIVGFTAGSLKFSVQRFVIACLLGKVIKFAIVAAAGYWGLSIFSGDAA